MGLWCTTRCLGVFIWWKDSVNLPSGKSVTYSLLFFGEDFQIYLVRTFKSIVLEMVKWMMLCCQLEPLCCAIFIYLGISPGSWWLGALHLFLQNNVVKTEETD